MQFYVTLQLFNNYNVSLAGRIIDEKGGKYIVNVKNTKHSENISLLLH